MRWTLWLWSRLLLTADSLLGTRLVERELGHRQKKIEQLEAEIEAVNRDLAAIADQLAFHHLAVCLLQLKARSERADLADWLHFEPQSDGEEALLDSTIECLVKHRLARINTESAGESQYNYRLDPDWNAIATELCRKYAAPELTAWVEERSTGGPRDE